MAGVSLKNVVKRFGNFEIIHGANLEIADGEFVVFVGPSGCGKSTLLEDDRRAGGCDLGQVRSTAATSTTSSRPTAASPWCSRPTRSIRI